MRRPRLTVQVWARFDWPAGTCRCALASRPACAVQGKGPGLDRLKRRRNTGVLYEYASIDYRTAHTQRNDEGSL